MKVRIRAVIVDDIPLARQRIARNLASAPDIEIVGEAANGSQAVALIARTHPDVAFLDVGLPDFDGFEVIRRLPQGVRPVSIYLTAHGDRALHAFEVDARDYLTKPFTAERLACALERARQELSRREGTYAPTRQYYRTLAIKDKQCTDLINVREIEYIDVGGHYLCVHAGGIVHMMRGQLTELVERLDPAEFTRIHRSVIVRMDRVRSLVARTNGDCDVILHDGRRLLMSRTYRERLVTRLGIKES
jgi:two-component system LytT family response regulator